MQHYQIVIVGTGFAGLGMAIRLKQQGIHDFRLIERANEVVHGVITPIPVSLVMYPRIYIRFPLFKIPIGHGYFHKGMKFNNT